MVVLVPVHVVELDRFEPHLVAQAADHNDAACRFLDTLVKQPAEEEVTLVVCAELAFEAVIGELLRRHLRDGSVANQRVDSWDFFQYFRRRFSHGI